MGQMFTVTRSTYLFSLLLSSAVSCCCSEGQIIHGTGRVTVHPIVINGLNKVNTHLTYEFVKLRVTKVKMICFPM